jgi:hypothetical protein|tara:strand:+ start:214 stop:504 length:291 start_codon:yes stop_codon:yes gene_type:complete
VLQQVWQLLPWPGRGAGRGQQSLLQRCECRWSVSLRRSSGGKWFLWCSSTPCSSCIDQFLGFNNFKYASVTLTKRLSFHKALVWHEWKTHAFFFMI